MKKVGTGKSIDIWKDKWIPDHPTGPAGRGNNTGGFSRVEQLITNFMWNRTLIFKLFSKTEAKNILRVPINVTGKEDQNFWTESSRGEYIVMSCYKKIKKMEEDKQRRRPDSEGVSYDEPNVQGWKTLWKLNIKHKIRIFLWRCISNLLPVREAVFRRTQKGSPVCTRCEEDVERPNMLYSNAKLLE